MRALRSIAVAGFLALALAACGSDGDDDASIATTAAPDTIATIPVTEPPDVPADLVGSWTVVSAGDIDAPDGVTLTVSSGGGVNGFLGCNEYFGSVSTADGELRFVEVSYAEIGCSDAEDFVALIAALDQVASAEPSEASATLSASDGTVVVVLERAEDAAPA